MKRCCRNCENYYVAIPNRYSSPIVDCVEGNWVEKDIDLDVVTDCSDWVEEK